ncbi:MAG: haloacid dehalogenase-like hydrolase [Microthrixaceae bacterium]
MLPFAKQVMEEHRDAGRILVMATTTPADLIRPLAQKLGFDEVIATRYGEVGGLYDGTINGDFVWGRGKAKAVREWAEHWGIDLSKSFAYSDSYQTSRSCRSGAPSRSQPRPTHDCRCATLRRWPMIHFDVPAGVPKFVGLEPQKVLYLLPNRNCFHGCDSTCRAPRTSRWDL